MFIVTIWRNEISKLSARLQHTARQAPANYIDFKDINRSLSRQINPIYAREADNNSGCENHESRNKVRCLRFNQSD